MKSKIYKKILNFALFLGIFSSLFFFIPSGNAQDPELEFWYMEDDSTDDTLLSLISDFEAENDITVNAIYKSRDEIFDDFKTAVVLGNAPDLIQGDAYWIPSLVHNDMLEALTPADFDENYMEIAKHAVSYFYREGGSYDLSTLAYYGFPQSVDTPALIYNTDEVGTATIPETSGTWNTAEFKSAITKMNDQSLPGLEQYGLSVYDFKLTGEALFLGAGGHMFSNNLVDRANIAIQNESSVIALNYTYEFVNFYELTPPFDEGYYLTTQKALIMDRIYDDFAENGNVSSMIFTARYLKELTQGSVFSEAGKLGIAPCPVDEDGQNPFIEVNAIMISKNSELKDNAKLLATHLTSKESMITNAKNEFLLPAILSAYDSNDLSDNTIVQAYKPLVERASPQFQTRYWNKVENVFVSEVTNLIRAKYSSGSKAADGISIYWSRELAATADTPGVNSDMSIYNRLGESQGIPGFTGWSLTAFIGIGLLLILFSKNRRSFK